MAHIMTKQGSLDNVITYEHYCDTVADLSNIPLSQTTLGSVAIVVNDEDDGMGIYIANSQKEWTPISTSISGGGSGEALLDLIHVCSSSEYDSVTKVPTVEGAESNKIYLVPNSESGNNVFDEWIYIDEAWERFGGGSINIPVTDVQVNGVSVLDAQGVATIPNAGEDTYGLVRGSDIPVQPGSGVGSIEVKPYESSSGQISTNTASGEGSVAFGRDTTASGNYSLAIGWKAIADGPGSFAAGLDTVAIGNYSYAQGNGSIAYGSISHSEGNNGISVGACSHFEGVAGLLLQYNLTSTSDTKRYIVTNMPQCMCAGIVTVYDNGATIKAGKVIAVDTDNSTITLDSTLGELQDEKCSFIIGATFEMASHAEGALTIANGTAQHVQGTCNAIDTNNTYADIVGNGPIGFTGVRSNAYALTWTGDGKYAGDVYVHANADSSGGTKLATVDDVTVTDVQVNGTSVVSNGVANVPVAGTEIVRLI